MKRLLARHSPLLILAGLCAVLAVLSRDFRQAENLQRVWYRTSVVGIVAIGQVLVIITAGIDLSVGSVAALSGVVACLLMKNVGLPVPFAVLGGAATGLLCGGVNGVLAAKAQIPPFIATLGMMMAARGGVLLLSGAKPVYGLPEVFRYLGGVRGWWIPVAVTVAITVVFSIVLAFTRFGRAVFATGGNVSAARLSGIRVDRVRIAAFSLCGLLTGFAGVMLASRTGIGDPSAAEGMELRSIAACVIGGASLMGGEGGALGALAGALIMNVLENFCNLKDYDVHWHSVLIGALIVALVYYDNVRKRGAGLLKD